MTESERSGQGRRGRRWLRRIAVAAAVLVLLPVVLVPIYAVVPPVSTLMLARWLTLRPVDRDWTAITQISPNLAKAVVAAEDARFCAHGGVDWGALRDVLTDEDGPSRGASTIPMQVARNLFLWQGGGYVRKPIEVALASWIDLMLSKRRILEIYLNIAEWGPDGVFGAAAGSRRAFRRGPETLGPRQAALMAAALPNPIARNPGRPSGGVLSYARRIEQRVRGMGGHFGCL